MRHLPAFGNDGAPFYASISTLTISAAGHPGPDGHPVSNDTLVRPPARLQWIAERENLLQSRLNDLPVADGSTLLAADTLLCFGSR